MKQGIDRLYFFTREGEFFIRLYQSLEKSGLIRGKLPDAQILEVSRMSTFMPSLREITVDEMMRLWSQYTEQSMEAFCKSLHIDIYQIEDRLEIYRIRKDEVIKNPWDDQRIRQLFLDQEFISRMEHIRDEKRCMLQSYLEQKGWKNLQGSRIGIVDIGWRGTIQDNLCYLYPGCLIVGFYIGMQPFFMPQPKNSRKYGYINSYKHSDVILFTVRPLEMLCNSAGGSVQSYKMKNGSVCAVKKSDPYEDAVYWSYTRKAQKKIEIGMHRLIQKAESERYRKIDRRKYLFDQEKAMRTLYHFIAYPERRTVDAYFSLKHNEEYGVGTFIDITAEFHPGLLFKCLTDRTARMQLKEMLKEASWPQGYFAKYWMHPLLVPYNLLLKKYLKRKYMNINKINPDGRINKKSNTSPAKISKANPDGRLDKTSDTSLAKISKAKPDGRLDKKSNTSPAKISKANPNGRLDKKRNISLAKMSKVKPDGRLHKKSNTCPAKKSRCRAAWLLPMIIEGSGGHRTIFQSIRYLISHGYECDVYIEGICSESSGLGGRNAEGSCVQHFGDDFDRLRDMRSRRELCRVKKLAEQCFGELGCRFYAGSKLQREYDIIFATAWHTAKIVSSCLTDAKKAYFIQDYEAMFQPAGEKYLKACDSYCLGLRPITIGRWLSRKMLMDFGGKAQYFDFCANLDIYKKIDRGKCQEKAVCFIYQPEKTRRCPNLGIAALGIVKYLRPSTKIYLYGSESKGNVWFEHENLKVLTEPQCNELYNKCTAGLCISSTNPSRIPFEMMAAGLPVVDVYMENNLYDMPDQGISLAHFTPESIAQALLEILDDDEKRTKMSEYGQAFMKDRTLEHGLQQFYRCVENIVKDAETDMESQNETDSAVIEKSYRKKAVQADKVAGMLTEKERRELESRMEGHSLLACLKRNPYIRNNKMIQAFYLKMKAF